MTHLPTFFSTAGGGSPLVRSFLEGAPEAATFYEGGHPADLAAYVAKAREVAARFTREDRDRLARALSGGGGQGRERLTRFVEEGGFAVTTGQQPGLFGGPLFTLHKALTAAALAGRLEAILGVPVLPVFWVASEDHDWAEVRTLRLLDGANETVELEVDPPAGAAQAPLFRIPPIPETMARAREQLAAALPPTEFVEPLLAELAAAYPEGATLPAGFATLLGGMLAQAGVFILSPENPEIQRARLPILLNEAKGAGVHGAALEDGAAALDQAAFGPPQVPILPGGVNLFLEVDGRRERLFLDRPSGEAEVPTFRLRQGERRWSLADLERAGEDDPGILTPNVLLRPVVESALIPTLAYVAGPGEMAYWGQLAPLFRGHGIRPPVVHPRWSGVLIEGKIEKVLRKLDVKVNDLRDPIHEIAAARARDDLPVPLVAALRALRGAVGSGSSAVASAIREVDPTLRGTVDHFRSQSLSLLDDVERKAVQALKRAQGVELEQLEKARRHVFPSGVPQERVFPAVYYLSRYGPTLLETWREVVEEAVLLPAERPAEDAAEDAAELPATT